MCVSIKFVLMTLDTSCTFLLSSQPVLYSALQNTRQNENTVIIAQLEKYPILLTVSIKTVFPAN